MQIVASSSFPGSPDLEHEYVYEAKQISHVQRMISRPKLSPSIWNGNVKLHFAISD